MPPPDSAIRCRSLVKRYGDTTALDGFDLEVQPGTLVSLLGPSGSGKTTALRLIAGFEQPDHGTVEIAGEVVADTGMMVPPDRRRVGMVFQEYALFPHMSVSGNVGYGVAGPHRRRRTEEVLDLVGMSDLADRMPHELSGGEQQRVALARALAPNPHVILADEPFSNLDAPRRERVRREVRTILIEARATAVFVTHDQEEALAMSDVVAVMRAGRAVQVAEPSDLYLRPADCWVARFLGEAEFFDGTAHRGSVETRFGSFPAHPTLSGPVEVMIRPESVTIRPAVDGPARVESTEFYGHDQLVVLGLEGGRRLLSRTGPRPAYRRGDRVTFEVGEIVAFPAVPGHRH